MEFFYLRLALLIVLAPPSLGLSSGDMSCERWNRVEITLPSNRNYNDFTGDSNPFLVELKATFSLQSSSSSSSVNVWGFYDGNQEFKIRFSPPEVGVWKYVTSSADTSLDGKTGTITATAPSPKNHGPVVSDGFALKYADGSPHFSTGTTCYQWAHKEFAMQQQTIETLKTVKSFNKIRMTVFPKWYYFNHANPVDVGTAFNILPSSAAANKTNWNCVGSDCESVAGSFDLRRFNVSFWQNYESLVDQLAEANIIADLIVFHPYDNGHWGFDCLGGRDKNNYNTTNDNFYLKYLAARMSSFQNVWWAMANEWSFCNCKSFGINETNLQSPSPIWDELFVTLSSNDPYTRQMSIHNGNLLYNHSRPWITHVSLQGLETRTAEIRNTYQKPVIWDEVEYEGDIPTGWGSLSGEEESDRFWWGNSLGVHVGHGETILRPNVDDDSQPLWWAKGGTVIGDSPKRIKWSQDIWTNSSFPDFGKLVPSQPQCGNVGNNVVNLLSSVDDKVHFHFVHFNRPGKWTLPVSAGNGISWDVINVDYWAMTQTKMSTVTSGNVTIEVPYIPFNVFLQGHM